jgi:nucleotide-binding universal stress UspA family protein
MLTIQRILCAVEMTRDDVNVVACASAIGRSFQARVQPLLMREGRAPATARSTRAEPAYELDTEREAELVFAEWLASTPGSRVPAEVNREPDVILARSDECEADLIVVGAGAPSAAPPRRASLADELVRCAPCPVLTVPLARQPARVSRILLPVDFSSGTERAVEWAATLAQRFAASVHVLHAVGSSALRAAPVRRGQSMPTGSGHALARVAEIEERLRALGVSSKSTVAEQGTTHAILACRERESCDFIVMGVHHHRHEQAAVEGMAAALRRRVSVPVFSMTTPSLDQPFVLSTPREDTAGSTRSEAMSAGAKLHAGGASWAPNFT